MKNRKLYVLLIAAVLVIAVVVTVFLVVGGNDEYEYVSKDGHKLVFIGSTEYSEPIKQFLKATLAEDGDGYFSVFPTAAVEDYKNESAPAVQIHMGFETVGGFLENQIDDYLAIYGDNLYINAKVLSEETVSFSDIEDWNLDEYTWKRYVTEENTEEIKKITLDYTIGGDLEKDNRELSLYVVKQDGKWYLHSVYVFKSL